MVDRLPEFIDPLHLAEKRAELKGKLFLSSLNRLSDILYSDSGVVNVSLSFSREERLATVAGQIYATLDLICQNCAQPLGWTVHSRFKLGLVNTIAQADRLPADCEPLLCEAGQKLPLKDIVEDELLLALPAFPKHEHPCFALEYLTDKTPADEIDKTDSTENPFALLAKLKKPGDS